MTERPWLAHYPAGLLKVLVTRLLRPRMRPVWS